MDLSADESVHIQIPVEEPNNLVEEPNNPVEEPNPVDHPAEPKAFGPIPLKLRIIKDFEEVQKCNEALRKYETMYAGDRVLADVENIVQLCEGVCGKENLQ